MLSRNEGRFFVAMIVLGGLIGWVATNSAPIIPLAVVFIGVAVVALFTRR